MLFKPLIIAAAIYSPVNSDSDRIAQVMMLGRDSIVIKLCDDLIVNPIATEITREKAGEIQQSEGWWYREAIQQETQEAGRITIPVYCKLKRFIDYELDLFNTGKYRRYVPKK